jgi:hypothetical protein
MRLSNWAIVSEFFSGSPSDTRIIAVSSAPSRHNAWCTPTNQSDATPFRWVSRPDHQQMENSLTEQSRKKENKENLT